MTRVKTEQNQTGVRKFFLKFQTLWIIHTGIRFASVNWIRASRWQLLEMHEEFVSVLCLEDFNVSILKTAINNSKQVKFRGLLRLSVTFKINSHTSYRAQIHRKHLSSPFCSQNRALTDAK